MDFNTWLMIVGGLVFTAGMFTLIGHSLATDECQKNIADSRTYIEKERELLRSNCRTALNQRDNALKLVETGIVEHNELTNLIITSLRINNVFKQEHLSDALLALTDLIKSEHQAVLDVNSPEIKRIISKAKREHGKKIRKAADRKLEKSERTYEQRLIVKQNCIDLWKREAIDVREQINFNSQEFAMFQGIVSQELDNYIRLPSVRNACIKAINANHKAWQEL